MRLEGQGKAGVSLIAYADDCVDLAGKIDEDPFLFTKLVTDTGSAWE